MVIKTNFYIKFFFIKFYFLLDHESESTSTTKKKSKNKPPKKVRHVRMAGGTTWEDETLAEWDPGKNLYFIFIEKIKFSIFR